MILVMTLTLGAAPFQAVAAATELASRGKAAHAVVVAPGADAATQAVARELAENLSRITGSTFELREGDGSTGLAVGTAADFPHLDFTAELFANDDTAGQAYLLRSHSQGVYLIAAGQEGVSHAVWDFLHRVGYRQFFPGRHWEIIPHQPELSIEVDERVSPAYLGRRIWYGFGNWNDIKDNKTVWDTRNRMGGVNIAMGHAWDTIYRKNKDVFDANPNYLVSQRPVKFRIGDPGLRQLVIDHALAAFEANPKLVSISLDPSDGGGWEDAEEDKLFASISDRVVTLANEVAQAVNAKFKDKYIGIYAYHMHSPPPSIRVHPNVVVGVATSFIKGGYTVDELMEGWSKMGAKLGIREYYSVVISHKERPGGAPGSDLQRLVSNTRRYHANGARFMSAEASDSWGTIGLSYYVASRLYWNPDENVDAMLDDFFAKSFGSAQEPMRAFYQLLDRGNKPLFSSDQLGRMYRHLQEAYKLTDDAGVRSRLDDLALYTRYAELLWDMQTKKTGLEGTGIVLGHAYRIRDTHMVHSYAMWRDTRGGGFTRPTGEYVWNVPDGKNPWKSSEPFTQEEIQGFVTQGVKNNAIAQFTPVSFSDELVPAAQALRFADRPMGDVGYTRGGHTFYLWLDKPGSVTFEVTGGQIAVRDGDITLTLYAAEDPTFEPAATGGVPTDKQPHTLTLTSAFKGLHRLEIFDAGRGAKLTWPPGTRVSIPSSGEQQTLLRGRTHVYFYVPKGTRTLGGYANGGGVVRDGAGNELHTFSGPPAYFSVPVPAGQDGKVWSIEKNAGLKLLMTVPPYLARSPAELLVPAEVVEKDRVK